MCESVDILLNLDLLYIFCWQVHFCNLFIHYLFIIPITDEGPFGASPDPPDPETLCRNIIEILDDNNEFPEKMRKLKAVVQPTSKLGPPPPLTCFDPC